jgi:hypothetical protein
MKDLRLNMSWALKSGEIFYSTIDLEGSRDIKGKLGLII